MGGRHPHITLASTPGPQLGLADAEMNQGRPLPLGGSLSGEEARGRTAGYHDVRASWGRRKEKEKEKAQVGWFDTTDVSSLTVLGARSLKLRCRQSRFLLMKL